MLDTPIKTLEKLAKEEFDIDVVETPKTPEKTTKEREENVIFTSYFETENYILEQLRSTNSANSANHFFFNSFIIFNKKTGSTEEINSFTHEDKEIKPIVSKLIDDKIILLPGSVEDYGTTKKLVKEIRDFLYEYFEVPKFFESFFPFLVLFYWIYDRFPFVPYVHFMGKTGTGKSTAMEVLGSICYKPINASGAITLSPIFRIASQWRGTLLIDEFNTGGENYKEMMSLLKSGVSDTAVLRTEGDKKREVEAYIVKSPKIFTSERPVTDAGFRSRIIEVIMNQNKRKIPLYRQKRFLDEAVHLRNKLLLWRLHTLTKIDLSDIEFGFKELSHLQGRVQQVITPIYFMADEAGRKEIITFAKEQQEETLRERRESLEGQLFEIIYANYQAGTHPEISKLAEEVSKGLKYPHSERKVAGIVRKVLELTVRKMGHENITAVDLSDSKEKIEELCSYYGLEFKEADDLASVAEVLFQ